MDRGVLVAITFDAAGFAVSGLNQAPNPAGTMRWSEVTRITAFKRDWLVVDCICLAIGAEDNTALEVHEDMQGWQGFIEALPDHLLGYRSWSSWFLDVAFPAFATTPTAVYDRDRV